MTSDRRRWNTLCGRSTYRRRGWCRRDRSWCRSKQWRGHTSRRRLRWSWSGSWRCIISIYRTGTVRLPMCPSSRRRWRRGFLLYSGRRSNLLCISNEFLDEVHILIDKALIHALAFKLAEEGRPGWIDVSRCEALFGVVTHVGYVSERP
jgi:hypothetical protein